MRSAAKTLRAATAVRAAVADRFRHLSSWPDPEGHAAYLGAYQQVLDELWPVPWESRLVQTRFGTTHLLVCGPPDAPPLVAFHGAGLSATSWYPNAAALGRHFRLYAADLVFDRGRGTQTAFVRSSADCAAWAAGLLDALSLRRAAVAGLSQGGWVAASLAAEHPARVSRLALLAPAGTLQRFRAPFWLLFRGAQDLLPKGDPRKQAARVFGMVGLVPDEPFLTQVALGSAHFREQRPPAFPTPLPDEALRGLTMPVLLLLAEREVLYNPAKAMTRARALVPRLSAEVVPGAGHFVAMAAPGHVDQRLLGFLTPAEASP
jgi:pimeloyl-ACP methyl ester carboxylesterase